MRGFSNCHVGSSSIRIQLMNCCAVCGGDAWLFILLQRNCHPCPHVRESLLYHEVLARLGANISNCSDFHEVRDDRSHVIGLM